MDPKDLLALAEKVKNNEASPEEELALLKHLNKGIEEIKEFLNTTLPESN